MLLRGKFYLYLRLLGGRALAPALASAPASAPASAASLAPSLVFADAPAFALTPALAFALALKPRHSSPPPPNSILVLKGRDDFGRIRPNAFVLLRGVVNKRLAMSRVMGRFHSGISHSRLRVALPLGVCSPERPCTLPL